MDIIVGKDLTGWRIETWYELRLPIDERSSSLVGYFQDRELVTTWGTGKGWYGSNAIVREVMVLTLDSKSGLLVGSTVQLSLDKDMRLTILKDAKSKLTPGELVLLGLS